MKDLFENTASCREEMLEAVARHRREYLAEHPDFDKPHYTIDIGFLLQMVANTQSVVMALHLEIESLREWVGSND